jgi:alkylation response protein AidB-like acyl-CoA dehydrogenase
MAQPWSYPDYPFTGFLEAVGRDFFADDPELQTILKHYGLQEGTTAWDRIADYGRYVATTGVTQADLADRPDTLPTLLPFDAWGDPHPVGLAVHPSTERVLADALKAGAATDPDPRVRYALAFLHGQVGEAGVNCPLACTDGLVRAVQELGGTQECRAAVGHILAQTPDAPVHAAQFVTEVQGGSDAAENAVVARRQPDGSWRLYGKKWCCSNAWAQYWAITARPEDAPDGPRGVALFVVPRELPPGRPNGFRMDRLKDKLGSRALPTGEMTLDGATGWQLGELGAGLSNMVRIVLTTSRFWNALLAASTIRAAERIARAYAGFRSAFGQQVADFPLVADTLQTLASDARNYTAAGFELLAAWEAASAPQRNGLAPDADAAVRARILVMLAKTCATERATQRVHDAMMVLAGNGIEERFSALPRLWRDAAILETWEGPHGLLLTRSLLDLRKFGAAESPHAMTGLLLGDDPDPAVVGPLGDRLGELLGDPDKSAQILAFRDWARDFYDALGELAWHRAAGETAR